MSNTYYEELTNSQVHALQGATMFSGTLSMIACAFVIWTYIKFRELRAFHLRIILNLTITDFLRFVINVLFMNILIFTYFTSIYKFFGSYSWCYF